MSEKKPVRSCSHCGNYHALHSGLCGNCELLSPERRAAQTKFRTEMSENQRRADEAAKKAYLDNLRDLNAASAAKVTGQTDTSSEKAESRNASLGK